MVNNTDKIFHIRDGKESPSVNLENLSTDFTEIDEAPKEKQIDKVVLNMSNEKIVGRLKEEFIQIILDYESNVSNSMAYAYAKRNNLKPVFPELRQTNVCVLTLKLFLES